MAIMFPMFHISVYGNQNYYYKKLKSQSKTIEFQSKKGLRIVIDRKRLKIFHKCGRFQTSQKRLKIFDRNGKHTLPMEGFFDWKSMVFHTLYWKFSVEIDRFSFSFFSVRDKEVTFDQLILTDINFLAQQPVFVAWLLAWHFCAQKSLASAMPAGVASFTRSLIGWRRREGISF